MRQPGDSGGKEQRLLRHARRESLLIMVVWTAALLWSCLGSYATAYHRPVNQMAFILGMPAWVFWFVALPWAVCLAFTAWFCFGFMADDDLGQDPAEDRPHE